MSKRKMRSGSLTDTEVGIIRNLLARGYKNQDILGLLNTVRRLEDLGEVNGGRVSEVRTNKPRYKDIEAASDKETDDLIQKAENSAAYAGISSKHLNEKPLLSHKLSIKKA